MPRHGEPARKKWKIRHGELAWKEEENGRCAMKNTRGKADRGEQEKKQAREPCGLEPG